MNRQQGRSGKGKSALNRQANSPKGNRGHKTSSKKTSASKTTSNSDEIRLNKYIANSGVCSRRDADMHISVGSVTVNGKVITEMGYKVKPGDEVRFDGSRISPEKKTYVLLNKPKGFATTTSETKGRTVMDLVANATNARIKPIGRLGRSSTGLLLFTNDDKIVKKFTNSNTGVARLFEIELDRNLKYEDFKSIQEGFKVKGKLISVEEISYVEGESKSKIGLRIKNTGNSILHTIFDHFKYDIIRIDCVQVGHLTKKDLPRGHWKHLTIQEVNTLQML
ncbi:pseudouridine synthase [Psychroserpens sp.]|uniref:pseudouridine synthase n=1 Tax=Psychroserpens sp. TaxID=2020870 RepID=UPI001B1309BD|nr:pseudouridine synthase [Psychroserpens sp.]MBO6605762.1 rRNA pseudouridine synthase [Psychroserpens sp.]MBO6630132.1 rRNA pseudouridine synthase [Psychroserpens sp.]MBO6652867.1 rRNA pseudouridine synthase [Psychroserpens sp.]MBO6681361.1 rRNA pseudouridine synthase [Psychroserpens sp.]MBO6749136.1 rRNA pseudouridine synthase [Psychroserpens sp.]